MSEQKTVDVGPWGDEACCRTYSQDTEGEEQCPHCHDPNPYDLPESDYDRLVAAARAVVAHATTRVKDMFDDNPRWCYKIPIEAIDALAALLPDAGAEPGGGGES